MSADDDQVDQDLSAGFKEELLQQFPDGSTLVLTSDSMQMQSDEGVDEEMDADATQQFVEEIIGDGVDDGGEHDVNDVATQQIHVDADGNHQLITSSMHDLITLHAVDSQGNIISSGGGGDEEVLGDHVGLQMDQATMESMMESDNIVEEVITSGNQEDETFLSGDTMSGSSDMQHQFLNVQDTHIFNPNTGTLQPINQTTHTTTTTTTMTPRTTKKATKQTHQTVTKYIIAQQPGNEMGGQPQQIILDANSLQTLIQGGGNISFAGASGKNLILAPSSPIKGKGVKSPAKILPAPIPIGDQQQASSTQKFLLKQGTVLTPITPMNQGGTRYIQMNTGSGNQQQIQYVRVIPNKSNAPSNKIAIAPALKPKPVAPKPAPGQTIILPAGTTTADLANFQNSQGLGNFVVLPNYLVKSEQNNPVPIRPAESPMQSINQGVSLIGDTSNILGSLGQNISSGQNQGNFESFRSLLEPNGMRPRKPCNCTKSACLKLYCDCFANGEFCHLCNCTNCFNNLNHEEDRQKAIKLVLERNPGAFRPKIGKSSQSGEAHERRHNKGCNCRRSGCLKNYCECYEAKIFCSGICKCTGCKNCIENIPSGLPNGVGVEQHFAGAGTSHRQTLKDLAEAAEVRVQQQNQVKNKMRAQMQEVSPQNNLGIMVPPLVFRYPHGSISYEVVTSTVELLLAKAEAAEKQKLPEGELERLILEEFGECLSSVMDLGSTVE